MLEIPGLNTDLEVQYKVGDYKHSANLAQADTLLQSVETLPENKLIWGDVIASIAAEIKRIERVRDFVLEPIKGIKASVEKIRKQKANLFDPALNELQAYQDKLKAPFGAYLLAEKRRLELEAQKKRDAEVKEAERIARESVAGNDFMADLLADEAAATIEEKALPKMHASTRTMQGTTYVVAIPRVRLVDITKVPPEYLLINEAKLLADKASGEIDKCPGIEFYEEASTRTRK